jgi:hypothetical protein
VARARPSRRDNSRLRRDRLRRDHGRTAWVEGAAGFPPSAVPSPRGPRRFAARCSRPVRTGVVVVEPSWARPRHTGLTFGQRDRETDTKRPVVAADSTRPASAIVWGTATIRGDHWRLRPCRSGTPVTAPGSPSKSRSRPPNGLPGQRASRGTWTRDRGRNSFDVSRSANARRGQRHAHDVRPRGGPTI